MNGKRRSMINRGLKGEAKILKKLCWNTLIKTEEEGENYGNYEWTEKITQGRCKDIFKICWDEVLNIEEEGENKGKNG